jgi:hypothetical protein
LWRRQIAAKTAARLEKQKKTTDLKYYKRHVTFLRFFSLFLISLLIAGKENHSPAVNMEGTPKQENVPAACPSSQPFVDDSSPICVNSVSVRGRVPKGK